MAYTTIDDPSEYFQTKLWSGNGVAGTSITNDGNSDLQPDFFWAKVRNHTYNHIVLDSTRGLTKRIIPNSSDAEDTFSGFMDSFDTDGFTLDNDVNTNESGKTYVAWQWKANGGTTSSNTSGTITSTVQANTTAGFSIATYTGNGTAGATFGHGLGVVPSWVIVKSRDSAQQWAVYHHKNTDAPETEILNLNLNNATVDNANRWNDTAPTSTLLTIKQSGEVNNSGEKYVAYFWNEVKGYSKFGSYKGNGNADGTFVYTGFKPAWVMVKKTSDAHSWFIQYGSTGIDTGDQGSNPVKFSLQANSDSADATENSMDFLSNGFKIRTSGNGHNTNSGTYLYMAFAEHPFVSSKGIPVTAR